MGSNFIAFYFANDHEDNILMLCEMRVLSTRLLTGHGKKTRLTDLRGIYDAVVLVPYPPVTPKLNAVGPPGNRTGASAFPSGPGHPPSWQKIVTN